ncbi:STAS domain-containing protein [Nocardioides pacificus]
MSSLSIVPDAGRQVIEIDGDLDCVTSYDLHRAVSAALSQGQRRIWLDLTRVRTIDVDGAQALHRCTDQVLAAGGELSFSGISRAALAGLATIEHRRLHPTQPSLPSRPSRTA